MEKKKKKMRTFKKYDITQEKVLKAINDSGGIVNTIAKRLNCSWITAKIYIDKWEETKQAYNDELQKFLDVCETVVIQSVKKGDVQTAKWVLSHKARERGYGDKLEVEGQIYGNINIIIKGE